MLLRHSYLLTFHSLILYYPINSNQTLLFVADYSPTYGTRT